MKTPANPLTLNTHGGAQDVALPGGSAALPPQLAGFSHIAKIGGGGFATVHKYAQDMPARNIAVKVPKVYGAQTYERFVREVKMLSPVAEHPAIVSLYQVAVAADGRPCLIMELCQRQIQPTELERKQLPAAAVLDAGVRVAAALETAHRAGIIHRDIKPSNILINQRGKAALTDFGIAAVNNPCSAQSPRGLTLPWAAPEVVSGQSGGSAASDIWSLAATLWQLLEGRKIFDPHSNDLNTERRAKMWRSNIMRAKYERLSSPSYQAIDAVLAKALQREPGARHAGALHFLTDLQRVQRQLGFDVTNCDIYSVSMPVTVGGAPQSRIQIVASRADRRAQKADIWGGSTGRIEAAADQSVTDRSGMPRARHKILKGERAVTMAVCAGALVVVGAAIIGQVL